MVTLYEYLHEVCNLKYISSVGSIEQDLIRFYKYNTNTLDFDRILINYDSIYTEFWNRVKIQKDLNNDTSNKIKLINPEVGKYNNIVKIDFKRAFTNYSIKYLSKEELRLYNYFCNKISRSYLLPESKKYLYNYVLTNIILSYSGKNKLNQLRYDVYEDVLYMGKRYGDIIKSEVDGCYVVTNEYNYTYMDVLGEYSVFKYDYIYFLDKGVQINKYEKSVEIKGINKLEPNIYSMFIKEFLIKRSDNVIENFFYSNKYNMHVIDWCKKSKDGLKGNLCLKNSVIDLDIITAEDVYKINTYKEYLNKNRYFLKISKVLEELMLFK